MHIEHGVGRYLGLQILEIDGDPAEFLLLEYAEGNKLCAVGSLHLISRYTAGDPDTAPLHRLGSEQWEKARRKARERARPMWQRSSSTFTPDARPGWGTPTSWMRPSGSSSARASSSRRHLTRPRQLKP